MNKTMSQLFISVSIMMAAVSFKASAQELVFNNVLSDVTATAQLNQFNIDPASGLPQGIKMGYVQIRTLGDKANSIAVTLYHPFICPPGKYCTMMMPAPVVIQVPVNSYTMNDCGVKTYNGSLDARRTDGALIQVTVIDNTHNTCPTSAALSPTEVMYETTGAASNQMSQSLMYGTALETHSSESQAALQ